jgi:hypothetical protein
MALGHECENDVEVSKSDRHPVFGAGMASGPGFMFVELVQISYDRGDAYCISPGCSLLTDLRAICRITVVISEE